MLSPLQIMCWLARSAMHEHSTIKREREMCCGFVLLEMGLSNHEEMGGAMLDLASTRLLKAALFIRAVKTCSRLAHSHGAVIMRRAPHTFGRGDADTVCPIQVPWTYSS